MIATRLVLSCDVCRAILRDRTGTARLFEANVDAYAAAMDAGWLITTGSDGLGFPIIEQTCPACRPHADEIDALLGVIEAAKIRAMGGSSLADEQARHVLALRGMGAQR